MANEDNLGKWVLVTGASRGIGKATALRLARAGYNLVLHANKNVSACEALKNEIEKLGREARTLQFDIADRARCREVLSADVEANGIYYGIVCNAGIADDAAFPSLTGEQWDRVVHTNLDGFYNVLQPLVMPMVSARKGGRIITLASVSGLVGNRGQTNYSASKAGIVAATKSLAIELAKRKITVNCVAPGLIETEMLDELALPLEEILKAVPAQRVGKPDEVAATIEFLLSPGVAYITRQVISVNGGLV